MELWTAAISDAGIRKSNNQDAVMLKVAQSAYGRIGLAAVCDGMGGLANGEFASAAMIDAIENWFAVRLPAILASLDREQVLYESLRSVAAEVDAKLRERGRETGLQMGTTVSILLLIAPHYYTFHVGDTRVYLNDGQCLYQLTKDHTYVQQEIDRGRMTAEEAEYSPKRSVLLQCVGAGVEMAPGFCKGQIQSNNLFLICSDGFRHVLSAEELLWETNPYGFHSEQAMTDRLHSMVQTVKARKEEDNISAILIKVV